MKGIRVQVSTLIVSSFLTSITWSQILHIFHFWSFSGPASITRDESYYGTPQWTPFCAKLKAQLCQTISLHTSMIVSIHLCRHLSHQFCNSGPSHLPVPSKGNINIMVFYPLWWATLDRRAGPVLHLVKGETTLGVVRESYDTSWH